MRIHSEAAWNIASQYSSTLASETRDLAAQIDEALTAAEQRGIERAAKVAEDYAANMDREWRAISPTGRTQVGRFVLHKEKAAEDIAAAIRASGKDAGQ